MSEQRQTAQIKSKCFVYLRRSQDREDRQSLSLEKQDSQVRQIIADNNLIPIFLPPEERSAKSPGRPIFDDMMRRIDNGEARYIVSWALSRISRNAVDAGTVVYSLDRAKLLGLLTPTRTYRNTPDDKAFLSIELAFAKKNNDDLGIQVKEGFETKRAHGQYPGPAPIGYLNSIIRPGERNIIPDPEKAPKIIRLFEMAATGLYNLQNLWEEAQNMALLSRTGNTLGKQTIVEVLKRRAYTGTFKYGGEEWHKGSYEALVSLEVFDKVKLTMGWVRPKNNERLNTTSGRFYPYKGLLLCKTCKFNITAYTKPKKLARGNVAEYIFYTCTKKNKKMECKEPQLSSLILEREIKARALEYEISEKDGAECLMWLEKHFNEYMSSKNQYRPVWLEDQKKAQKALDILDQKLETGVMTDERYKARSIKHEETVARTNKLLAASDTDAERWLELARETFTSVVNIGDVFEIANDEERRELMMLIGSNWYLSDKKVQLTPRRPLNLLRHIDRNTDWRALTLEVWNYFISLPEGGSSLIYVSGSEKQLVN